MTLEHQRLLDYLDKEANSRGLTLAELALSIGMTPTHLYNLRNGKQPGLQVCLDIARALKLRPEFVLYLAGHIREDELESPSEIPPELLPRLQRLAQLKGTPFFDTAISLVESAIDQVIKLFKIAA